MKTNALPKDSTLSLGIANRMLGRAIHLDNFDEKPESSDTLSDLLKDTFWECWLTNPARKEEVSEDRKLNQKLLEWLRNSQSWDQTRLTSAGSILASAYSAGLLYNLLQSDEVMKQILEQMKEAEKKQKEAQEAQDKGQNDKAQKLWQQAEALMRGAEKSLDKLTQPGNMRGEALRASVTKQAKEKTDEALEGLASWGMEPGQIETQDMADVMEMMREVSNGPLEELSRLFGRCKGIALAAKATKTSNTGRVQSIGQTRNITKLLPSELAGLSPEAPDFIRAQKALALMDHGLLGMIESLPPEHEGGFVMAVDMSGSMNAQKRDIKASALALGLLGAAEESGQPSTAFKFSSGDYYGDDNYRSLTHIDQDTEPKKRIGWAQFSTHGGTDFDNALTHAVDIVESYGDKAANTDIVLLSDGQAGVGRNTLARLADMQSNQGTRLFFVKIGNESNCRELERICTHVFRFSDNSSAEEMTAEIGKYLAKERG